MVENVIGNNKVSLAGEVVTDFRYSHEVFGEKFYEVDIAVSRLSDTKDVIPLMVSERLLDEIKDCTGRMLQVVGQFRSYNNHNEGEGAKHKLLLLVFVQELLFLDELLDDGKTNEISLDGFLCKPPVYRKTPLGREIADLLVAVNRQYGKSDYIPCIAWGRNARYAAKLQVGSHILICGRVQSREYTKKIDEEHTEQRRAYEVSIQFFESENKNSEEGCEENDR